MAGTHVTLSGSERPRKSDAVRVGDVDPGSEIEVTVTVRGPALPQLEPGQSISRDELKSSYAASPADLDKVTAELERYGLKVEEASAMTRSLRVRGSAEQMQAAFDANLAVYRSPDQGEFRGREGELAIPSELEGIVTGVLGPRPAPRRAPAARHPRQRQSRPGRLPRRSPRLTWSSATSSPTARAQVRRSRSPSSAARTSLTT